MTPEKIGFVSITVPTSISVSWMLVELIPEADKTRVPLPAELSESDFAEICTGWGKFQFVESNCRDVGPLRKRSLSPEIAKLTVKGLVGSTVKRTLNDVEFPSSTK